MSAHEVRRPLLRGLALANDVAVLRTLHGEALVQKVANRLTPEQRRELEAGFLPARWYEEDIQARLSAVVLEELGEQALVRLGVAIVRYHVSRTQRFLARIAGPRRLLQRSAGLWSYWRDTGRLSIEHLDDTSAKVAVLDNPTVARPGYAWLYGGASAYLVYLSGARQLRLHTDSADPARVVASLVWGAAPSPGPGFIGIDALVESLPAPAA